MRALRAVALCLTLASPITAFAADPIPLTDFAKHLQFEQVKISPDGKTLAAVAVVEGKRQLALFDIATLKGLNIRPRENDELADFDWVSSNRVVYTLGQKLGGIDKPISTGELLAVNADGSGNGILFGYRAQGDSVGSKIKSATAERASAYVLDDLPDDENNMLVVVNKWDAGKEGDFPEVARMNVRSGNRVKVTTGPIRNARFLVDHAGQVRFAFAEDTALKLKVYHRPDDKASWEVVLDEAASGNRATPVAFARDNKTVYWACGGGEMVGRICTWSDADRAFKPVWSNKTVTHTGLVRSFDGKDVVAVRAAPGRPSLYPVDKEADSLKAIVALMQQFPGDSVNIVSATRDGRKAIVSTWADVHPGSYYLLDRDTQKLTFLLARAPWVDPDKAAQMQPITLKARDGLDLMGFVTRPPGKEEAKNLPMVVLVHGGPHGPFDAWAYDPYVQALASRGYAVLQINFRGSGGRGYAFEKAGYGEWGAKMQDDVTDATKWAIAEGIADPKRVCIYGGSYGGYAALQGAVREPDLYRCAVGDAGVYDLRLMFSHGDVRKNLYGQSFLEMILGKDQAVLAQRSPVAQVDHIKAKVMLIAGGQDERVPPVHAERLRAELQKRKVEPEWLYKRSEGHGFYDEANRAEMLEKLIAFLDANTTP